MGLKPLPRFYKPGWFDRHKSFVDIAKSSSSNVLLIGDCIVSGLLKYSRVWSKYFEPYDALNFGSPGDCVENVMWRVQHGELSAQLEITVTIPEQIMLINILFTILHQESSRSQATFSVKNLDQMSLSLGYYQEMRRLLP